MDYPTSGASLGSILSVYDIENKNYYFIDEMFGVGTAETVKYSKNSSHFSYIYNTLSSRNYLEIFDTKTKEEIKLTNYLPEKYVHRNKNSGEVRYNRFTRFDNVEWSKNSLELYFDFYAGEEQGDEIEQKIGTYVFDVKNKELRELD